jgi:CRP-like cAMP-binding protein
VGDSLYIIETGQAAVEVQDHAGRRLRLGTRGPGETLGEIALVTGGERTADVIALTPLSLLRLNAQDYARYLGHMAEVERKLAQTAAGRATETALKLVSGSG